MNTQMLLKLHGVGLIQKHRVIFNQYIQNLKEEIGKHER